MAFAGFDPAILKANRPIGASGWDQLGQRRNPGGIGREADFPAQAQVAAWAWGSARHSARPRAAGPVALLWAEMAEHSEMISFFIF